MGVFILKVNDKGESEWTTQQRAIWKDFLNERKGKNIRLKAEDLSGNVSDNMRAYYWGALIPWIRNADDNWDSMSDDTIHEALKLEFNAQQFINPFTNEKVKIGKSIISRGVSTDEGMATINRIIMYFQENYLMPPAPDPMEYKLNRDGGFYNENRL